MNHILYPEHSGILPSQARQAFREGAQLVTVRCIGGSNALLALFENRAGQCVMRLCCDACIGKAGAGKRREGDMKTPLGTFPLNMPFGLLPFPDERAPLAGHYLRVTPDHYWCGQNGAHYNRLIDASRAPDRWQPSPADEHLCDYVPSYHYALFIGYNAEGVSGRGSAIFLHCTGKYPYTAGCVAVSQDNMRRLLCLLGEDARICIFE